jgi:Zn-dependent protease/CBS domain-containing protein
MGENVRLGRVAGIPVGMNWSLLVVFVLITLTLAESFSHAVSGYPDAAYWLVAVITTVLFYACLLAHELAHSLVARRLGVPVHGITLWLFGGVSQLGGEPATAENMLRISVVGPLMSVALGVGFGAIAVLVAVAGGPDLLVAACGWLGGINLFLALFNLAPAAPLDGGRVLAALLWRHHGDRVRAAVSATRAGMAFGYVLITLGVVVFLAGGGIGGLWFVFLGWFLLSAARAESSHVQLRDALAGVRVADVMTPDPVVAPASLTVEAFFEQYALRHRFSAFPLRGSDGELAGVVTLSRLKAVPAERRESTTVRDIACPMPDAPVAAPDEPIVDLLSRMTDATDGRALVLKDGHLVGLVSPTDISRTVSLAAFRPLRSRRVADDSSGGRLAANRPG